MDSPDRNLTITSSETQGSPFFNFLCNLSPIKPVKSVHVAQTFSELSFPPPPPVFVSPRVDAQKSCSLTKRDTAGSAVQKGRAVSGVKNFIVPLSVVKKRQFSQSYILEGGSSIARKSNPGEQSDLASPNSSPSKLGNKYVEQYLADPVEGELYSVGMTQQFTEHSKMEVEDIPVSIDTLCLLDLQNSNQSSKQTVSILAVPEVKRTGNDDLGASEAGDSQDSFKNSESQDLAELALKGSAKTVEKTRLEDTVMYSKCMIEEVVDLPCESASAVQQLNSKNDCTEELSGLARATSAFTFLMSDGEERISLDDCELKNWQDSAMSDQQESYLAAMRQIINEDMQEEMKSEPYARFHSLTESKQEGLSLVEETKTKEASDGRVASSFKAGNSLHRGARRRCLDFEASEAGKEMNNLQSLESVGLVSCSYIQESFFGSDTSIAPSLSDAVAVSDTTNNESPEASDNTAVDHTVSGSKVSPPISSTLKLSRCSSQISNDCSLDKLDNQIVCSSRISGTSPMSSGMPSGIGLHLNSLAGSISFTQITKESSNHGNLVAPLKSANGKPHLSSIKEGSRESSEECLLSVNSGGSLQTPSFGPGLVVSLVEKTRLDQHEVQATGSAQVGVTKSTTCIRSVTLGIKPLEGKLPFGMDKKLSPARKRMLLQDFSQQSDHDVHEDCTQQSPQSAKKKRGKSSMGTEKIGDGCKRCNCKKSKCLKLYCECFAAGVYCVDSCTCLDCFNKPEFEDTVLGTRQQIESRNPLAFAPKIIRTVDSSPTVGEECGDTPASARHKRGCNCKKSQCLKKYCECFQAGVGCSEVCRCEGCKNLYGRKEGTGEPEDKEVQMEETEKEKTEEKAQMFESKSEFAPLGQQANKELFPSTPFQCTGQGRLPVKLRSFCKGRLSADDLKSPTVSQPAAKPLKSPQRLLRSGRVQSGSKGMHSQHVGSPASVPKVSRIGQFSPRWDGLGDLCTLTPLPQPPLRPTPASASILDRGDSSPTLSNEPSSSCNCSMLTSSALCGALSPVHLPCSPTGTCDAPCFQTHVPNPQTTPGSPLFSSPLCGSRRKSGFGESSDICSQHMEEDYTPDFLKDPDAACSPIRILKTSSPKQKRVSPPHHVGPSEMGKRSLASPGLKSGRRFILQAISSVSPSASTLLSTHGQRSNGGTLDQEAMNSSNT